MCDVHFDSCTVLLIITVISTRNTSLCFRWVTNMERNLCKNTVFSKTKSKPKMFGYLNLSPSYLIEFRKNIVQRIILNFWEDNKFEVILPFFLVIQIQPVDVIDLSELGWWTGPLQLLCFWTLSIILFLFNTPNVLETGFCLRLQVEPAK
jgi:hypothetical protein